MLYLNPVNFRMTETKVPNIPYATTAHQQSLQGNPNGFVRRTMTEINNRINTAIEKGQFKVRLDWLITGAGIIDQYREATSILQTYYHNQGYHFDMVDGWMMTDKYYTVAW